MRRLSYLILGLLLAYLGVRTVAGAETFAPFLLADALLLGGLGALIFALNAGGRQPPPVLRRLRGLPRAGWTLLLTGLLVTLGGGLGLAAGWTGVRGLAAAIAWGLGILLQLAGAWWPGAASEYARPAVHWGRDTAGKIVLLPTGEPLGRPQAPLLSPRAWRIGLLLVLLAAALLRFWDLAQLPLGCIDQECAAALRLLEGDSAGPSEAQTSAALSNFVQTDQGAVGLALDERLASLPARATGSGLLGLRLGAAVWGWLTVLWLALALRRLVDPLPALLGTALLAISPWHLWAGRTSDPWLLTACLSALALWLGLEALARDHARWWLPWGLAGGLLAVQTPLLWPGAALWALTVVGAGLVLAWRQPPRVGGADSRRWPLCALAAALGVALPIYPPAAAALQSWTAAAPDTANNIAALFAALLRPETTAAGSLTQSGLLTAPIAALTLVGAGALLRHLRRPAALLVLVGTVALLGSAALLDLSITPPAAALLPALPLLLALAAVALDRLLVALAAAWGPPLMRAAPLLGGAALLILLPAGRSAFTLLWELGSVRSGGGAQIEADMAHYIAARLGDDQAQAVTFVAPRAALEHPSLRLLAGAALAADRILPLELGRTLPYAQTPTGDVEYLLPLLDAPALQLLRELYPSGEAAFEMDADREQVLFNRYRVRQADLVQAQTLSMTVAPVDSTAAAAGGAGEPVPVTALDFAWAAAPPHELPFTAQWSGSLVAPVSGDYAFAVTSTGPQSTFTLTIDDILLLDSSLNLLGQQMPLAQGIHRLHLSYRSGEEPGDLHIIWQPPGKEPQTLAAPWLHSPMLPDQGLLGDYYGSDRFEGAVVAEHKDPILGLDPGLPLPYSVRWHGLLAAPRGGDYLIGIDAPGAAQVAVNGLLLADNRARQGAEGEAPSSYSEGVIYLPVGWHSIEVRYAPEEAAVQASEDATGGLRLLWQPPGSDPSELAGRYLLPAYGLVSTTDAPLPPPPSLADGLLGDDRFALSRPLTAWQPSVRVPPADLPTLALERLWVAGGVCGSGSDQLNAPHGAALAADGSRLYVADTGNRRIQVFDADGALLDSLTSDMFQEPAAVAVGPDGSLFVLDALAQQVFRVDQERTVTALPLQTSFYRPRGLAVDELGNIAVADTGGGRVVVLRPDGSPALEYGGQGSLLARGQPVGVLAAPGALWAISAEDGRLWNLSVDGSVTAVQPTGTADGPQLAQLGDGRLLASDPARAGFTLLSSSGEPLAQFGYSGELQLPTGIAAAANAEDVLIAVVDTRACAVSVWRMGEGVSG